MSAGLLEKPGTAEERTANAQRLFAPLHRLFAQMPPAKPIGGASDAVLRQLKRDRARARRRARTQQAIGRHVRPAAEYRARYCPMVGSKCPGSRACICWEGDEHRGYCLEIVKARLAIQRDARGESS